MNKKPRYDEAMFKRAVARARAVGVDQASEELGIDRGHLVGWMWLAKRRAAEARKAGATKNPRRGAAERGRYTVEELSRLYEQGKSTSELASLTGRSQSGVYALLRRHGVTMRSRKEAVKLRKGGTPTHGRIDRQAIYDLKDAGNSTTKIAAMIGVSVSTVAYHLKRRPSAPPRPASAQPTTALTRPLGNGFGQNLRFLRAVHGLTGAALAQILKVTPQTFSEWEHAAHDPTWSSVRAAGRVFGVPTDLLADGTLPELGLHYFTGDHYSETEQRIIEAGTPRAGRS